MLAPSKVTSQEERRTFHEKAHFVKADVAA
jgi:hypothetical protein